jgi:hypothetical protein
MSNLSTIIDSLDPNQLALQELAAILACSEKCCLPEHYLNHSIQDRGPVDSRIKDTEGV